MWPQRKSSLSTHRLGSFNTFNFRNYILEKSNSMDDLGGINWKLFISLAIAWLITAVVLLKGVETMGRITPITDQLARCCRIYIHVFRNCSLCNYYCFVVSGGHIRWLGLGNSLLSFIFELDPHIQIRGTSTEHNIKAGLRRGELQRHTFVTPWQLDLEDYSL